MRWDDPSPTPLIMNFCRWTSVLNKVAAAPTRPERHYPYCLPLPTTILLLLSRSYYTHNFTPITLKQLDRAISVSYKCVQLYRAYTLYPIIERLYHYKVFFTIQERRISDKGWHFTERFQRNQYLVHIGNAIVTTSWWNFEMFIMSFQNHHESKWEQQQSFFPTSP